ncbi:amidohydrolase/deacetylase family metallohydrolase [Dyadobacter subterraneus]|uniref:Amidohydrolase/deacetylase family metallohydrolase n=1 Tax=Dyadobacter subterraneus TaxID=2773304 RepID=A0ABR9WGG1_9BACT|nr:amidohydrolase/deacetylase family metallohydrolase [Dyadobacter subterraneus]MBE9464585.1 amidohydrolase/deacetylase family metallohydrolase [Dyadobacter subterraneus]
MNNKYFLILCLICLKTFSVNAQTYSILIKGGTVIDPKNNLNQVMDIGIFEGKVKKVAKDIDPKEAAKVIDAKGMYVTPGLIDIHGHVFFGTQPDHYLSNGLVALPPDGFTFRVGVTTIVDAGGAGWEAFPEFKKNVILHSKTRVLSFLNIVGAGMRGGQYEQDTSDMDSHMAAAVAIRNKNDVVGFKAAHFVGADWKPIERVVEAGKLANMPVMIDFGGNNPPLSLETLFTKYLRPGDIFTHALTNLEGNVRETIVDEKTGKVKQYALDARKKGIIFDVGYGGASFNYSQAIPAIKNGFLPNTISTDLHTGSMNSSMKDMLSIMSKFLVMGVDLPTVIKESTWAPAQVIKRENLGHLSENAIADIAIFSMREGKFGFYDRTGYKMEGKQKLECEMTIMGGKIVYDLNGMALPTTK